MLSTELAATAEALYDRALVRGEQLMHARACDVLALIEAARAQKPAGDAPASDEKLAAELAAAEAKIKELEAWQKDVAAHNDRLTADLAASEAKVDEADRLLATNGQAGLELATALAEKGRFESLTIQAVTQNELLQKALDEKTTQAVELDAEAQAAAKALEIAQASASTLAAELEAAKAADAAKAETIAKLETTVAGLKAAIAAST
jgi:oligoribonuclease (3'-5' exoribonuclease)